MKVYFTGSIQNSIVDKSVYKKIVSNLESMGHKVISSDILDMTPELIRQRTINEKTKYYKSMNKRIASCDIMVCEASYPSSISIGHEITVALDKGKPIIALHQPGKAPGVLQGITSDRFMLFEYAPEDLKDILEYGVEGAEEKIDVRFNFFIPPKISQYLEEISKKTKTPRAVYLRNLIEEDMKNNTEFND